MEQPTRTVRAVGAEGFVFLLLFVGFFGPVVGVMGMANFFKTLMGTAHDLLINTVFFLMAVAVVTGALGALFSEFGVVHILDRLLRKLMRPLFNLPGMAVMGVITTYLSDNPAIISLARDRNFLKAFKKWQLPLLCNLGTSFGMGLIVSTYMLALGTRIGTSMFAPVLIGNLGALIGSITSVRIMAIFSKKELGDIGDEKTSEVAGIEQRREIREGSIFHRLLAALLEGGKTGVDIGLGIIPGVLVVSTLVVLLTYGPKDPAIGFQGLAYEGVGFLPWLGEKIFPVLEFLFGFKSPELIAFPLTSLGSSGAALALIPRFIDKGILTPTNIAVFTSMGMCWSGYLSTHIAMMDALGYRSLTNKALFSHTVAGLVAGMSSHFLCRLFL
ncbi:MAG TPA: hypothetical protein P5560_09155 [Thermotogota bacterium]|nr:hypothetical protein [Thermotogota bacterium]HRW93099.1 hypothetical protein [Thermotogota bacterium]